LAASRFEQVRESPIKGLRAKKRIGNLTGGGDVPGLNSVKTTTAEVLKTISRTALDLQCVLEALRPARRQCDRHQFFQPGGGIQVGAAPA